VIGPTPLFTEQVTLAAARHHIPVVYYIHAFAGLGTYRQGALYRIGDSLYRGTYYRRALGRLRHATSSTQDFADSFRQFRGPWTIIPNGVSDPCIASGRLPPLPAEAGPHPELRVLFVGQLRPYKAVDHLIRGVAETLRGGKSLRLTVVGDGPVRSDLEHLVDELGVRPAVVFKGPLSDEALHAEYLSNDLLALPSVEGESFGIVLLEARLHGLDLLASDLPGVREVVHQVGGALVPPGDPHAIAAALQKVGPLDPSRRVFNSEVAERYSWKSVASAYLELYREVLAGPPD
jgi:phosphatidyl-myo-inositol alpha-mannosyltransferase